LGFDQVVDHRATDFAEQLTEACPNGVDVYFENVDGAVCDEWYKTEVVETFS